VRLAIVLALTAMAAAAEPAPAVDPRDPGANLPAEGRSLFDFAMMEGGRYSVPFPFEALLARIARRCDTGARDGCLKAVLIPLGRSLQRGAAAPAFFRFPRIVAAVTEDTRAGVRLRDRLYLGYQEKAAIVEVISYNEAAGRFEFQVVRDYRAGATPRVSYANRALCVACHQNHGPIFPRASWDETNANPKVATRLLRTAPRMHGIAVDRGIDIPNAIDDATDRAAFFPAYQRLWREGCASAPGPARCRAALFRAALQHRLTGGRSFGERARGFAREFAAPFDAYWAARWPEGLAIGSPDIPNRDPFAVEAPTDVRAAFDPLEARAPVETWIQAVEARRRLAGGLADFLADGDARSLVEMLYGEGLRRAAPRRGYAAGCAVTRAEAPRHEVSLACDHAALRLAARIGLPPKGLDSEIRILEIDGERNFGPIDLVDAKMDTAGPESTASFAVLQHGRHVRLGDGDAIERITLRWEGVSGEARVTVIGDFAAAAAAIDDIERQAPDVFSSKPFRRAATMEALFASLGARKRDWCCLDTSGMPAPEAERPMPEGEAARDAAARRSAFHRYCGACHLGPERFPPDFLAGDARRVEARLAKCAERINARLAMWSTPPQARAKSPMPPQVALAGMNIDPSAWTRSAELASLREHAGALLPQGTAPSTLVARGYETLQPCTEQ
jgi:hypothetical protein